MSARNNRDDDIDGLVEDVDDEDEYAEDLEDSDGAATGGAAGGNVSASRVAGGGGESVDEDGEDELSPDTPSLPAVAAREVMKGLHDLRVTYIRASQRLGKHGLLPEYINTTIASTLTVMDFFEDRSVPYPPGLKELMRSCESPSKDAHALANMLEGRKYLFWWRRWLNLPVKVMLVGRSGVGKSELINALLGKRVIETSPFTPSMNLETRVKGRVEGVLFEFLELPGLRYQEDTERVKQRYKEFDPDAVLYVDRMHAGLPAAGPGQTDQQLLEGLFGDKQIDPLRVTLVLTHAGSFLQDYVPLQMWQSLLGGVLDGELLAWVPVELHPEGARTTTGHPVVGLVVPPEGEEGEEIRSLLEPWQELARDSDALLLPWRAALHMMLVQLAAVQRMTALIALSQKYDPEQRQVHVRVLPPVEYFVEDMVDDVDEMPDPWDHESVLDALEDPYDMLQPLSHHFATKERKRLKQQEADWADGYAIHKKLHGPDPMMRNADPSFNHMYLARLREWARQGDPLARREYDRYKLRYNWPIAKQLLLVEPDAYDLDYGLAQTMAAMPLPAYLQLRDAMGKKPMEEVVALLAPYVGPVPAEALLERYAAAAAAVGDGQAGGKAGPKQVRFAEPGPSAPTSTPSPPPVTAPAAPADEEETTSGLSTSDLSSELEDPLPNREEEEEEEEEGPGEEGAADDGGEEEEAGMPGLKIAPEIDFGEMLDLPSHIHGHRFRTWVGDGKLPLPFTVSFEQDYYRYERDNGIMGVGLTFDFEQDAALGKSMSIGGVPIGGRVNLDCQKDGADVSGILCTSMYHSAPPYGPKHVSEVMLEFQTILPNRADTFYSMEWNTYRESLWGWSPAGNCPPSMGVVVARMAELGNPFKGPVGVGMRGQANVNVGNFDLLFLGGKMACFAPNGAVDEGWSLEMDILQPFFRDLDLDVTFFGFNKHADVAKKLGLGPGARVRSFGCQAQGSWAWDFGDCVSDWSAYWQLGRSALLLEAAMETTNPIWGALAVLPALSYVRTNLPYWAALIKRMPGLFRRLIRGSADAEASDRRAREEMVRKLQERREAEAKQREAAAASMAGAGPADDASTVLQQVADYVEQLQRERVNPKQAPAAEAAGPEEAAGTAQEGDDEGVDEEDDDYEQVHYEEGNEA